MTVFNALTESLLRATEYNKADQVSPVVVLWPDKERQWEPLIERLRGEVPLLTLGDYAPATKTGPAIYLRCLIARTLPDANWPEGQIPILYLPGISRAELRAVEDCPPLLQPLAELQYRGVFFTQKNGKDWTVEAFLRSADGGLEINVSTDTATREAMRNALLRLADENIATLQREAPLTASKFHSLLNPEPIRALLLWLDDPKSQQAAQDTESWAAFCAVCQQQFGFHPETDGPLSAAQLLGERQDTWNLVWERFAEAPHRYPNLPELLHRARPKKAGGFFFIAESWPQDNEGNETELRALLSGLATQSLTEARATIQSIELKYTSWRKTVWAELKRAPLAQTLTALRRLVEATQKPLGGATPTEIAEAYFTEGWKADAAALDALVHVETPADSAAVKVAVETLYRPWLVSAAEAFQKAVEASPLPSAVEKSVEPPQLGCCYLFADGLRLDQGQRLAEQLEGKSLIVQRSWRFTALPSVTATAKPAAAPVAPLLGTGSDLTPKVRSDNATVTAEILRRELAAAGYKPLTPGELGTGIGAAWTELGTIDAVGHAQGWKLAQRLPEELAALTRRIQSLLEAGWQEVRVVTDHGWLLLPETLPKVELPEHLTEVRKGRCARLKPSASTTIQTVPWQWDASVRMAMAPGIGSFIAGKEYEHGGLSPQECVVPVLRVRASAIDTAPPRILSLKWRGLRCELQLENAPPGARADLRSKPADPATSRVAEPKVIGAEGKASLLVPDDTLEGTVAAVVVLSAEGTPLAQETTTIGGDA